MSGIHPEDTAHVSGHLGSLVLGVRKDTAASTAGTADDYSALTLDEYGQARITPGVQAGVELAASAARTATSTGLTAVSISAPADAIIFQLDVTAAATDATDTLNVFVQTTVDGTKWSDIVSFTQVLGNGGAKRYLAKVSKSEPQAMFENATALAAGSIRHLFGKQYRVRYDIVDDGADDASFTFSVTANVG